MTAPTMMKASATHRVLIPSYNTGPQVLETVRAARARHSNRRRLCCGLRPAVGRRRT